MQNTEMQIIREVLASGKEMTASEIAYEINSNLFKTLAILKAMGNEIVETQRGKKITVKLA